ncbi:hypothetical protein OO184_24140 [Photorhabdus sp. APURE]|nr:hypothetical protein [Photorhabdus aballayi]MCW7550931.1 hypothetical protein [Photorhabdus aballayi]
MIRQCRLEPPYRGLDNPGFRIINRTGAYLYPVQPLSQLGQGQRFNVS